MSLTTHPTLPISFILNVTITIKKSNLQPFFALFKPIHDIVLAEPECAYFIIGQQLDLPGITQTEEGLVKISWSEGWTKGTEWFFGVQMKKGYYGGYLEATEKMFEAERQVQLLTPAEGMCHFKSSSATVAS